MKTKFTVSFTNEFGIVAPKQINCETAETTEQTFKNALKRLEGPIARNWESIEFPFDGKLVVVSKGWLHESGFDFSKSHVLEEIPA